MNFREHLTIEKKSRFLDAVRMASETIGVAIPHVNFDGCSFDSNENAHIHIEQNTICVSERYLKWATYEDIEDTAMHEVTHLKDKTHNFSFRKSQALVKTYSWMREHRPESEKNDIDRYDENVATATDEELNTIHINRCEQCDEEISKVTLRKRTGGSCDILVPALAMPFVCKYCGGYYCEDHRLPENHKCIGLELWKAWKQKKEIKIEGLKPLDDETKSLVLKKIRNGKQ